MKISVDKVADAGYIRISNRKINKTVCASDYCNIDLAEDDTIVGIELLFISQYVSDFKFWLDLAGAAEYLNKSKITVRRWIKEGKIPHYKIGKEYAFNLNELDEFVQGHKKDSESHFESDVILSELDEVTNRLKIAERKIEYLTMKRQTLINLYGVGDSGLYRVTDEEMALPATTVGSTADTHNLVIGGEKSLKREKRLQDNFIMEA